MIRIIDVQIHVIGTLPTNELTTSNVFNFTSTVDHDTSITTANMQRCAVIRVDRKLTRTLE